MRRKADEQQVAHREHQQEGEHQRGDDAGDRAANRRVDMHFDDGEMVRADRCGSGDGEQHPDGEDPLYHSCCTDADTWCIE